MKCRNLVSKMLRSTLVILLALILTTVSVYAEGTDENTETAAQSNETMISTEETIEETEAAEEEIVVEETTIESTEAAEEETIEETTEAVEEETIEEITIETIEETEAIDSLILTGEASAEDDAIEFTSYISTASTTTAQAFAGENAMITDSYIQEVGREASARGLYGRVIIPCAGIDVGVDYTTSLSKLQTIVDADDTAAMFDWNDGNCYLADHSHQGFGEMRYTDPDSTSRLYIVSDSGVRVYRFVEKIANGWNDGGTLSFNDHTPISERYDDNMISYTCNSDGTNTITIMVWERV